MKKTKKKINGGVPPFPRFKILYKLTVFFAGLFGSQSYGDLWDHLKSAISDFFESVGEGIVWASTGIVIQICNATEFLYNKVDEPILNPVVNAVARAGITVGDMPMKGVGYLTKNFIWNYIQSILKVILFVFASSGFIDLILYFLKSPFFLIPMILNTSKYISSTLMAIFVKILNAIGFHYSLPFFQVANQPYQAPPPQYQQPPPTLIKIDQPLPPPQPQPITIEIDPQQTAKAFDNEYLKESIKMMNNKVEQMTDFADKMTKNMFELLKQSNENKNIEVSELKQAFKKQSDDLVELTKKLNETTNKTDNISKIFNDSYNYIFDKMIEPTMNKLYNVLQNPAVQYIGTAIILIIALKYIYIVVVKIYKWIFNIKTETEEDKEIKKKVEHILEKNEKLKHKLEELMHENKNKMKKIEKKVLDKFTFEFKKAKNLSKKGSKIGSKTKYSKTKSRTKLKGN